MNRYKINKTIVTDVPISNLTKPIFKIKEDTEEPLDETSKTEPEMEENDIDIQQV